MARKKDIYYDVKNSIENLDLIKLNKAYEYWLADEQLDLKTLYEDWQDPLDMNDLKDLENQEIKQQKEVEIALDVGGSESENEAYDDLIKTIEKCESNQKADWKKLLEENPEYIVLNKDAAKKKGLIDGDKVSQKKEQEILKTCDDRLKILLLQFFKDLAHLQGYKSVRYNPIGQANEIYCGLECVIEWNTGQVSSGIGDAHTGNCGGFSKYYVGPIAQNRSYVRAVKDFFNIPLIGADEIGETPDESQKSAEDEAPTSPAATLRNSCKNKLKITEFDAFKAYLRKQYAEAIKPDSKIKPWISKEEAVDWANYKDWSDVKPMKIMELKGYIDALKK